MRLDVYLEKSNTPVEKFIEAISVHPTQRLQIHEGAGLPRPQHDPRVSPRSPRVRSRPMTSSQSCPKTPTHGLAAA